MGYALRLATANGLTFHDLALHLASPGHLHLPASAIKTVAFMFGCRSEQLQRAFVVRRFLDGSQAAQFLDHLFLKTYHLRQVRPQLCPLCLAETGRARAAWSVCLLTSCVYHGVRLVDRCACSRPIRWRRPALDFCECGVRLTYEQQGARAADPRELAISGRIEALLESERFHLLGSAIPNFPPGFENVTIDSFVRLVWIFGILDDLQINDHPNSANRGLSTPEAAVVACRAYERLISLISDDPQARKLRFVASAFRALFEDVTTESDLLLISQIASRLVKRNASKTLCTIAQLDGQLNLF